MDTSKDYTGKGTASYPNGDVYQGDFVEGVSYTTCFSILNLIFKSWERVKVEPIHMPQQQQDHLKEKMEKVVHQLCRKKST